MAWNGLNLTVNGRNALSHAQVSGEMSIKSIVIGDGNPPDNFNTQEGLVHQLYEIKELKIDVKEDGCELTADFPKVGNDYYFREIGVIVTSKGKDILYVYDNCGSDAQLIVNSDAETTEKRVRLFLKISDVQNITVQTPSILYVSYDEFIQVTEELRDNKADKKDLTAHINNMDNPHQVTKEHIGLGNVDNTADSEKPVSKEQQRVIDEKYKSANTYTDQKVAQLVNGAPETLDTLKEIADAMVQNKSVVEALNNAIGTKMNKSDFDSYKNESKTRFGRCVSYNGLYEQNIRLAPGQTFFQAIPTEYQNPSFFYIINCTGHSAEFAANMEGYHMAVKNMSKDQTFDTTVQVYALGVSV